MNFSNLGVLGICITSIPFTLIPAFLNLNFGTISNSSGFPVVEYGFQSEHYKVCLLASSAAIFPIFIMTIFHLISTAGTNSLPRNPHTLAISFATIVSFVPDLFLHLQLAGGHNLDSLPCVIAIKSTLTFSSILIFICCIESTLWTIIPSISTVFLFIVSQILSSSSAFVKSKGSFETLYGIRCFCSIFAIFIMTSQSYIWIQKIKNKIISSYENILIHGGFIFLNFVQIYSCIIDIALTSKPIYHRNSSHFTSTTYISTIFLILCIFCFDMIIKLQYQTNNGTDTNESKLSLLRYVSNQLRVPLNTVSVGLCVLRRELKKFDKDVVDTCREAAYSCELAFHILDNLLLYEKLKMGVVMVFPKKFVLKTFMKSCLRPYIGQANDKSIKLKYEFSADAVIDTAAVCVYADTNRLGQVIRTIMCNAIQHTKQRGSIRIDMVCKCRITDPEEIVIARKNGDSIGIVELSISDNGSGLSQDQLDCIFDDNLGSTFKSVTEYTTTPRGFSLYISKNIIDLHKDAELSASSEGLGRGCCFKLRLPFYLAADAEKDALVVFDNSSRNSSFQAVDELFGQGTGLGTAGSSKGTPSSMTQINTQGNEGGRERESSDMILRQERSSIKKPVMSPSANGQNAPVQPYSARDRSDGMSSGMYRGQHRIAPGGSQDSKDDDMMMFTAK